METKSKTLISVDQKAGSLQITEEEFNTLLTYYATGKIDDKAQNVSDKNLTSINFSPNLSSKNNFFPLCILKDDPERISLPLNDFFELLLHPENQTENYESSIEILKELKQQVKTHLNGFSEEFFSKIWEKSIKSLIETHKDDQNKIDFINNLLQQYKNKLNLNWKVIALNKETAVKYLQSIIYRTWPKKSYNFAKELETITNKLNGLLESDTFKTSEGKSADHLKSHTGDSYEEDIDFNVLSSLLDESIVENTLTEERKTRIRRVIKNLNTGEGFYKSAKTDTIFTSLVFQTELKSIESLKNIIQKYSDGVIEFFKAVHIARLEISNKYTTEKHNAFFEDFNYSYLNPQDLANIAPLNICIHESEFEYLNYRHLADLLDTDLPVKIILNVDDIIDYKSIDNKKLLTKNVTRKLTGMAIDLQKCYIIQSTVNNMPAIEKTLIAGMDYNGPALFCINHLDQTEYNFTDLSSAYEALHISRAFPAWYYVPDPTLKISKRFNIETNPDAGEDWPESSLRLSHIGDEVLDDIFITYIDFVAHDKRLIKHFISTPFEKFHKNLVSVEEYMRLDDNTAQKMLPYTLMTDEKGHIYKIIPDFQIINSAYSVLDDWRTLQEMASVKESGLALASRKEDPELINHMEPEPLKSIQDIQHETITNILNRLINGELQPGQMPLQETKKPFEIPKIEQPPEEITDIHKDSAAEPVQKSEYETTEPSIDTALCTSCGDCININSMMFAYDDNKQAYIKDVTKGTFKQLVMAAEKCPAFIIHPGKPKDPNEKDLDKLLKRAEKFN